MPVKCARGRPRFAVVGSGDKMVRLAFCGGRRVGGKFRGGKVVEAKRLRK